VKVQSDPITPFNWTTKLKLDPLGCTIGELKYRTVSGSNRDHALLRSIEVADSLTTGRVFAHDYPCFIEFDLEFY
jgi:hypothetical protein